MNTPFDWQEAVGHRASFIESRLALGTPVLAVSIDAGIVLFTYKRQARKLFEVYDHLAMAGIGQQSDIEMIRMAALDFAHHEGYQRSERDVTIQRVVNAVAQPIKRAFADFSSAPFVALSLFAEVSDAPGTDKFVMVDYDGDYHARTGFAYLAAGQVAGNLIEERLGKAHLATAGYDTAIDELESIWREIIAIDPGGREITEEFTQEIAVLERTSEPVSRFRYVSRSEF